MTPTLTQPRQLAALLVAHAQLVPSLTNPRKRFDKDRLEELALSMAPPVGILEPLVVRPFDPIKLIGRDPTLAANLKHPGPFYEIIAGERRWRAAKIAKIEDLPIVVRDIADDQVIKLQLVENKNREDIHPLDEAEAMDRLLRMNKAETPKTIAATIGMSERYVQNRLHYLRLVPDVKEAFRRDEVTAGHVDLIMRLPADEQKHTFKAGLYSDEFDYDDETGKNTKRRELRSVRDLGNWIAGHVRLTVVDPKAPEMELFPEVAQAVAESAVIDAPKLLELVDSTWVDPKIKPAPLTTQSWVRVKKGQICDHQARGVIVIGRHRGVILTVCTGVGQCKMHWAHTIREATKSTAGKKTAAPKKSPSEIKWAKDQAARKSAEKAWLTVKPKAVALVNQAVTKAKPAVAVQLIAEYIDSVVVLTGLPKRPSLTDLLRAVVKETADGAFFIDFERDIAKPLGVNLKPLFADAERKERFGKMSDQEAGAAAIREQAKKKAPKKRKAGAKK